MPQSVEVDIIDNYPDWMSQAYDQLKDLRLCELPLPGSHDAGAYDKINERSKAQGVNVARQLVCGYRYFDFRVCVDNGKFYVVHGPDETDNVYGVVQSTNEEKRKEVLAEIGKPFLFDDIQKFCLNEDYSKELVILHFSHFEGKGGQNFNAKNDQPDFADLIREYFGDLLVPPADKIPTYGKCIADGKRIVAIVDNDDSWYDKPGEMNLLWSTRKCFLDRYSDKYVDVNVGEPIGDLQAKIDYTLDDQQTYLLKGGDGHRDPDKFWVTQGVLNYAAVTQDGKSQNYHGAKLMNRQFVNAYKNWRKGLDQTGRVHFDRMQTPNVLLMDYAGYFLGPKGNDPLHLF